MVDNISHKYAEGVSSVKVHHQPGGASSFSLGHDDGSTGTDDRFGHVKKGKAEKIDPASMPVAGGATETLDAEKAGKAHISPVKDEKGEEKVEEEMKEGEKKEVPAVDPATLTIAGGSTAALDAKAEVPSAGPGAKTSVKFSGQPPGGKSSITF